MNPSEPDKKQGIGNIQYQDQLRSKKEKYKKEINIYQKKKKPSQSTINKVVAIGINNPGKKQGKDQEKNYTYRCSRHNIFKLLRICRNKTICCKSQQGKNNQEKNPGKME